jgi:hypothetical protein
VPLGWSYNADLDTIDVTGSEPFDLVDERLGLVVRREREGNDRRVTVLGDETRPVAAEVVARACESRDLVVGQEAALSPALEQERAIAYVEAGVGLGAGVRRARSSWARELISSLR